MKKPTRVAKLQLWLYELTKDMRHVYVVISSWARCQVNIASQSSLSVITVLTACEVGKRCGKVAVKRGVLHSQGNIHCNSVLSVYRLGCHLRPVAQCSFGWRAKQLLEEYWENWEHITKMKK